MSGGQPLAFLQLMPSAWLQLRTYPTQTKTIFYWRPTILQKVR